MLGHYLAITLRNLRRAPGAAALNVVTLALGLVAMVTAYAYVAYLDRADRQFPNADRIQLLAMGWTPKQTVFTGMGTLNQAAPEVAAAYLREDFPDIEKIARAIVIDRKTMVASGDRALRLLGVVVDPEFVDIFGLRFAAGDSATALRSPDSVVLTEEYARKLFDERNPIGEHLIVQNAVEATVTGVLAPLPEPSHFGKHTPNARLAFDMLASADLREKIVAATNGTQQRKLYTDNWYASDGFTYVLLPAHGLSTQSLTAQLDGFVKRHVPPDRQRAADYKFGL